MISRGIEGARSSLRLRSTIAPASAEAASNGPRKRSLMMRTFRQPSISLLASRFGEPVRSLSCSRANEIARTPKLDRDPGFLLRLFDTRVHVLYERLTGYNGGDNSACCGGRTLPATIEPTATESHSHKKFRYQRTFFRVLQLPAAAQKIRRFVPARLKRRLDDFRSPGLGRPRSQLPVRGVESSIRSHASRAALDAC